MSDERRLKVVDSSGWVEHFADGPLADGFAPYLADPDQLVTPTVVLYEVYRWARRHGSDADAMEIVGHLEYTRFAPVDTAVAIAAVDYSRDHGLAAMDALVYATARLNRCELVTSDTDFRGLTGVTLIGSEG
ncbi:MAG: type II toxin-antitoxin system VapC family toxin [Thermoleophilia bacterium]|nr:type II toxin-antitoxin system VapC family toxin [Thermoleophilia bacterium]